MRDDNSIQIRMQIGFETWTTNSISDIARTWLVFRTVCNENEMISLSGPICDLLVFVRGMKVLTSVAITVENWIGQCAGLRYFIRCDLLSAVHSRR